MKKTTVLAVAVLLVVVGLSGCITSNVDIIIDDNYYKNAP